MIMTNTPKDAFTKIEESFEDNKGPQVRITEGESVTIKPADPAP